MAVGLIGGTGVYDPGVLKNIEKLKIITEYGEPSDEFTKGTIGDKTVYILPRHGHDHRFNPSNVPYRANIAAFKKLGVKRLISVSAVGSLKEEVKPGDFVFTDQFFDRTTKRIQTFYDKGKTCHISVAEPFSKQLRQILINKAKELGYNYHETGTCIAMEGPRFSTKAESNIYRKWGADIINMTLVPEVVLAREAEISYANIAMVTDYDVWKDSHVSNEAVVKTMKENIEKVKKLLMSVIPKIDDTSDWPSNNTLKGAMF